MSIYFGNDMEDRLKISETESALLKKYNDYHQLVHEIDHMPDLHVDCSFYKQSSKFVSYFNPKQAGGGGGGGGGESAHRMVLPSAVLKR